MKSIAGKMTGGIVLLLVLSFVLFQFLLFFNNTLDTLFNLGEKVLGIGKVGDSIEKAVALSQTVDESMLERAFEKTQITAVLLEGHFSEDAEDAVRLFQDGAIIRLSGSKAELPEGLPYEVALTAEEIRDATGYLYSTLYIPDDSEGYTDYVVYYHLIDGQLYYIEWEEYADISVRARGSFDFFSRLEDIEKAFDASLLIVTPDTDESGRHPLLYSSSTLPACTTAEELGVDAEILNSAVQTQDQTQPLSYLQTSQVLQIDGVTYELFLQHHHSHSLGENIVFVYMLPVQDVSRTILEQTLSVVAVFAIAGIVLLVWMLSVRLLIHNHSLNDEQKREFGIKKTRTTLFAMVAAGGLAVLIFTALFSSLNSMYTVCETVETSFASLRQKIEENNSRDALTEKLNTRTYEGFATLTAGILEEYPESATAENLQAVCDFTDARYIMLFDADGNETLSNSRYTGLSLGSDPSSATYDFRPLLNGVPLITRGPMTDEATQLTNVMVGVSLALPEEEGRYGALLMAVPAKNINPGAAENAGELMTSLTPEGMLAFSVDPGKGTILASSDPDLTGRSASALGLPDAANNSEYRDFFTLNGLPYYGECEEINGKLYYYAADKSQLYRITPVIAVTASVASVILLALFALYLIAGYRKYFDLWAEKGDSLEEGWDEIESVGGKKKYSVDPSLRWRLSVSDYGVRTPFHNTFAALKIMLLVSVLVLGVIFFLDRSGQRSSLIRYIMQGNWSKGWNLFSITGTLILAGQIIAVVALLKAVLRLLAVALGTKGETVCRLLSNLLSYAGSIYAVYYAFLNLGFNPTTLLASLGLLSFAVSLGAKDLVTDVVAGLSIVFEGEYQVGDIIDIGGYRGKVLEIGVRTTKLEGRGGNIKIIANRDVKNVINMTRMNSWYPLEINISTSQPLAEIEKTLSEELPRIGKSIPEIISGPFYKGVLAVKGNVVTISIIAECNEEDIHSVQRSMNRSIQELVEKQALKIM